MTSAHSISFASFVALAEATPDGVVLLEGRRNIPSEDAAKAQTLARSLTVRFPRLRFRSGNATGADEAFSAGVASVDPGRLQVIAPYASHRKKYRIAEARYDSPETLSAVDEEAAAYKTSAASPKIKGLVAKRKNKGPLAAKAAYLIRDTMKATGHSESFPKPICALFYVDKTDPMAGGTGHTIRVCQQEGVPVAFQDAWATWFVE
ncbi:hypothetical protein [Coraliomargarita parva]|uniref:hypothetical protein n=1 Tax=Coraliomargarita parva TaxID=3014050 RepID=UPI0022B54C25|nr:hypothetical protein [Coraliomargarita parva]